MECEGYQGLSKADEVLQVESLESGLGAFLGARSPNVKKVWSLDITIVTGWSVTGKLMNFWDRSPLAHYTHGKEMSPYNDI